MARPIPVLTPKEMEALEEMRDSLRMIWRGFDKLEKNYSDSIKAFKKLKKVGTFGDHNIGMVFSQLLAMSRYFIQECSYIDSTSGGASHQLRKEAYANISRAVRKVSVGASSSKGRRKAFPTH
jgi:hypothetical protein